MGRVVLGPPTLPPLSLSLSLSPSPSLSLSVDCIYDIKNNEKQNNYEVHQKSWAVLLRKKYISNLMESDTTNYRKYSPILLQTMVCIYVDIFREYKYHDVAFLSLSLILPLVNLEMLKAI